MGRCLEDSLNAGFLEAVKPAPILKYFGAMTYFYSNAQLLWDLGFHIHPRLLTFGSLV